MGSTPSRIIQPTGKSYKSASRLAQRRHTEEDDAVQKTSLTALARTEMQSALRASSGRSAKTIYGGHEHRLRQTLIAIKAGEMLAEHENPGEATVQVVQGRILLTSGEEEWSGWTGDLIIVPDAPHSVTAVEDSSILLTVVKLV
jgi:quercetin dioxygenase-like cupin family protein